MLINTKVRTSKQIVGKLSERGYSYCSLKSGRTKVEEWARWNTNLCANKRHTDRQIRKPIDSDRVLKSQYQPPENLEPSRYRDPTSSLLPHYTIFLFCFIIFIPSSTGTSKPQDQRLLMCRSKYSPSKLKASTDWPDTRRGPSSFVLTIVI